MNKKLYEYLGESVRILLKNKTILYAGIIDAVFFTLLMYVTYRISVVTEGTRSLPFYATGSPPPYFITLITFGSVGAFFLAGKLSLIRKAYQSRSPLSGDEAEHKLTMHEYVKGMERFGLRMLAGRALVVALGFGVIFVGILPLLETGEPVLEGLSPILFLLALLLVSLWDVIMVAEGVNLQDAFKGSISFVKSNYVPVLIMQLFAGLIAFRVFSGEIPLRIAQNLRADSLSAPMERVFVSIPPVYQGIMGNLGEVSWVLLPLLIIPLNVLAPMILMDLYLDRKRRT